MPQEPEEQQPITVSVRIPQPLYQRVRHISNRDGMVLARLLGRLIEEALEARGEHNDVNV